jgi:hypothetical protein
MYFFLLSAFYVIKTRDLHMTLQFMIDWRSRFCIYIVMLFALYKVLSVLVD